MKKMKFLNRRLVIFAVAISMVLSAVAITTVLAAPTLKGPYNPGIGADATKGIVYDNGMNYDYLGASQFDTISGLDPIIADDFILTAPNTIVNDVHWIGGYWNGPPDDGDFDWEITFYEDDGSGDYPGTIYAGPFLFPNAVTHETFISGTAFSYWVDLPSDVTFTDSTKYWMSIQGIGEFPPQSGWMYHATPILNSEAVFKSVYFSLPDWTQSSDPAAFDEAVDMAFQLTYELYPEWWPYDYKWLQNPDPVGWDCYSAYPVALADDFLCTETGWIKDIHFWGSWFADIPGAIDGFWVSIHSDIPGDPSMPGPVLWWEYFPVGTFAETFVFESPQGFYETYFGDTYPDNHVGMWRYDIELPEILWFHQDEGTVYWLDICANVLGSGWPMGPPMWGWKSSPDHWNDDAFMGEYITDPPDPGFLTWWYELYEPLDFIDSLDLAFVITGEADTPPGNDCANPKTGITLPADLPVTDSDTTCGRIDDYEDTCLGYYDGGEDIIYEIVVTETICVDITLDPKGTTYTGICIDDVCPPGATCIDYSTSSGSTPHKIMDVNLDAGTYYIMIDTWPSPDCIPDFDLIIEACAGPQPGDTCDDAIVIPSPGIYSCIAGAPRWYEYTATIDGNLRVDCCGLTTLDTKLEIWDECSDITYIAYNDDGCYAKALQSELVIPCIIGEDYYIFWDMYSSSNYGIPFDFRVEEEIPVPPSPGDDCSDPIIVSLPAEFDYHDLSQYTCGRGDDYADTCLGYYDGGEDIIYEIVVTSAIVADISLDNTGATWIGMAIDDSCPPGATCLDYVTSYTGPWEMTVSLAPGTYYLMVDTWPSPPCIDSFDLHIVNAMEHDVGVSEIVSPFGASGPPKGDAFYGCEIYPDMNVLTFTDPGTITNIATLSYDVWGGDMAGVMISDTWYAIGDNDVYTIDESDGSVTVLGSHGITDSITGLAYDPSADALYACGLYDPGSGYVVGMYEVDMGTGAATYLGDLSGGDTPSNFMIIDMACDNDGTMYGVCIVTDSLYEIDVAGLTSTLIGSTGVDHNYAQGMAYDREEEILYIAAEGVLKGSTPPDLGPRPSTAPMKSPGGLYSLDTATGVATSIGAFEGGVEIDAFAIPYSLAPPVCWDQGTYPVEVMVKNYGDYDESSFDVCVEITEVSTATLVYTNTQQVIMSMNPGDEILLDTFVSWDTTVACNPYGDDYVIEACTLLLVDDVPGNDCEDEDGCLTSMYFPPVADADGPYYANLGNGFTVAFDGSASYDPDGLGPDPQIVAYDWDFGDGQFGTGATPTHIYGHAEEMILTKTVTLTVEDNEGETDTTTTTVTIAPFDDDPPIVQLEYPRGGEDLSGTINIRWYALDTEDQGSPDIYLIYSNDGGSSWLPIAGGLENTIGPGDHFDRGEYSWSTGSMVDGNYMVRIFAYDFARNMAQDTSGPFAINNHNSGVMVSYITVSSNYVKNDDSLEIKAGISQATHLTVEEITADLSGLGKGTSVPADSFDGLTATWILTNVVCTPSDGPITITVTTGDESNTATITADNTLPELNVIKPENALYFLNAKLLTTNKPIIIGAITLEATTYDTSGMQKTEIYIDDELKETLSSGSDWYMNLRLMGRHSLKIVACDNAGNVNEYEQTVIIFNPFGDK